MKVISKALFAVVACAGLLVAGCGKGDASGAPTSGGPAPVAASSTEVGVAALPAETRVILHLDIDRGCCSSELVRGVIDRILASDAEAQAKLTGFLQRCKIDPARDLGGITIGMAGADDVALLVRGKLDEKTLVECIRAEATASGGALTATGKTWVVSSKPGGASKVYFGFAPGGSVVAATSQAWLDKVLDSNGAKLASKPETMALVSRLDPASTMWAVGFIPANVGDALVKLAEGKIAKPAVSVTFELKAEATLHAALRVDMQTSADADALAAFAKSQMDWIAVLAQKVSLGQLVSKVKITAETKTVTLAADLDEKSLSAVVAALKSQTEKKEP